MELFHLSKSNHSGSPTSLEVEAWHQSIIASFRRFSEFDFVKLVPLILLGA